MKKFMILFVVGVLGAALIGCGKADDTAAGTSTSAPVADAPKTDGMAAAPKGDAPKTDAMAPKADAPKTDAMAPKADAPKTK